MWKRSAELGGKHVISSIWTLERSIISKGSPRFCDLAKQYDLTVGS